MDFPNIPAGMPISLDYEASGLQYWVPDFEVYGAAVATDDGQWYYDFRETPEAVDWIRSLLPGRKVAAQYAQYEVQCSRLLGVDPFSVDWYCTMTVECLIDEHHLTYDLYSICGYYGIESKKKFWLDKMSEAMGGISHKEVLANLKDAPKDLVKSYAASDARDAYDIYRAQQKQINDQELWMIVALESELIPVLADMSWGGVRVDLEAAHAAIPVLDQKEDQLRQDILQIVGGPFNVNSSKQVRDFFKPEPVNRYQWRLIDGTIVGPTKGGKGPCLDQNSMREIKHPLAEKILALRKTIKLRDTFVRGHVIANADQDGYVHTTFNQTRTDQDAGTVTGRLSATDPAVQQITKRDKINAAILRSMFLGDEGEDWWCFDYNQVDFRCAAHLQNDQNVILAYQNNPELDYHQVVSDMTNIPRNAPYAGAPNTKQINLGLSFGAGEGKLAFMMGMPYKITESRGRMRYEGGQEAKDIFAQYHLKLPATRKFMKHAEQVARTTGYVRTQLGRRLRFPRGMGAHKAAGLLYQAYAADLHKIGLVNVHKLIRSEKMPVRLMMSCHDEIGLSGKRDQEMADRIQFVYTDFMGPESRVRMNVPILSSGEFGPNWYEASK